MKRIISFIMTLTILCGVLVSPLGTINVHAATDWSDTVNLPEVVFRNEDSVDAGGNFPCDVQVNTQSTIKDVVYSFLSSYPNCIPAEKDGLKNKVFIELKSGDDFAATLMDIIFSKTDFKDISDMIPLKCSTAACYSKENKNELDALLNIVYISGRELKTARLCVWTCTNGLAFASVSFEDEASDITDVDELTGMSDMNGGEEGLLDVINDNEDIFDDTADPKEVLMSVYGVADSITAKAIYSGAESKEDNPSVDVNDLFRFELSDGEGTEVNISVYKSDFWTGSKRNPIVSGTIRVGTMENDVYSPNPDDLHPEELNNIIEFYDTHMNNEFMQHAEDNKDNDNVWKVFNTLANKTLDTNIQDNTDPDANRVALPILNDFKVLEYILRCSMKKATTDTSDAPYVHTVTISCPTKPNLTYEVTLGSSNNGDRTTIENIKKNGTNYDLLQNLPAYQYDSLRSTYRYIQSNSNITNPKAIIMGWSVTDDMSYRVKTDSKITDNIVDEATLRESIEEFETYTFTRSSQGVIDIARLASVLTKYTLYHSMNTNFALFQGEDTDGDGEPDLMDENTYNDILQGLLNDWAIFDEFNDDTLDNNTADSNFDDGKSFAFVDMPSNVGVLGNDYGNLTNDSINGDLGFSAIMNILYAQSYVFEALNSSAFGVDNKFDPVSLGEIMKDPHAATEAEYNGLGDIIEWLQSCNDGSQWQAELAAKAKIKDTTNIWIFRSIIELYDTIELLEINPNEWSDTIAAYYQLYVDNETAFNVLRNSPLLYGTGYTGGATTENPLGVFYSVQGREMSEKWNIGFANSALYVPMVTNLYNASIYEFANTKDSDWISEFMYKYGFHRKALYISTDPNVIVNNKMNKSSDNGMVIATLKDLLNYERDIQLYIDTSFYNANEIEDAIGKVDYATLYQYMHDKDITVNVTDEAALENLENANSGATMTFYNDDANNFIDETLNLDAKTLLKDEDIVSYSVDVAKNVTHLGETATETESLYDGYVLSADALTGEDNIFSLYNYTPMLSYAVVSAIYRDVEIYNELSAVSKSTRTVFESSKNILYADGTTNHDWIKYMNYLQLANLENQMNVNVETQLDLNSPIFIDIFGNIVTESGFVIIPAASNATLCGDNWTPYTIGFGTYMAAGGCDILTEDLPDDVFEWLTAIDIESSSEEDEETKEVESLNLDSLGAGTKGGWFVYTRDGELQLKNVYLQSYGLSAAVNWSTLNANSDVIQEVFWNNAFFAKSIKMYNSRTINMVTEVLRGAPIENIDYYEEGIKGEKSGEAGIVLAYALDELLSTLSSDDSEFVNSMTTMPNVAFMPYLKYVIYFAIKITLALFILVFLIRLFMAGVKDRLGVKEVFKLAFTIIIVASAVYILPNSITWSYDKANATMLTDETEEILLYSAMRNAEGQQIGITEVSKIDENTQLLVQVDEVNPSWSKILGNALLSNEYTSFTDLFEDSLRDTPYYNMAGVVQKGTDVYIDINTILDSTRIAYNGTTNTLYNKNVIRSGQQFASQKAVYDENGELEGYQESSVNTGNTENPTEAGDGYIKQDYYAVYSFTSPYYVILDQLIANINEYNQQHNVQTYTASIDSKGKVMTYDVAAPYLLSDEFMVEGYDILGLTDALMCERQLPKFAYIFDEQDKMNMKQSAWYPNELDEETKQERIANVYNYARTFIVDHKEVIKHIPDEMLIKVLAFACSVKFNQEFHCPYGDSVALITVDNRDLMRFMLSDFEGVYSNVSYSFGRFVYQTSGTIGVILAAILCAITLLTTVIKPLLICILFVLIIVNILFREILFDKPNQGVEGYFIGCALFMCVNFIYSGCLKVCFIVADSNLSAVSAMLLCILVQVLYLIAMGWLVWTQVSDWKRSGYSHYANGVNMIGGMFQRAPSGRRRLDGSRTHSPGYYDYGRQPTEDVRMHPSDEPQGVYVTDRPSRTRRNRRTYNGPMSLDEMRLRDEERESSPFRR